MKGALVSFSTGISVLRALSWSCPCQAGVVFPPERDRARRFTPDCVVSSDMYSAEGQSSLCKIRALLKEDSRMLTRSAEQFRHKECSHPVRLWFRAACLQIAVFAAVFVTGRAAENDATWWFCEPQTNLGKAAFTFTWAVLMPLMMCWTVLGMKWLTDTLHNSPECFSDDGYTPTMCVLCAILCGVGSLTYLVIVGAVWEARKNLRKNAAALQSVEDEDLVQRWGRLKADAASVLTGGLSPEDIAMLPRHSMAHDDGQCVICLSGLMEGEQARTLPGCGHCFHRSCIDLWLLRRKTCPLCNAGVDTSRNLLTT